MTMIIRSKMSISFPIFNIIQKDLKDTMHKSKNNNSKKETWVQQFILYAWLTLLLCLWTRNGHLSIWTYMIIKIT